jgi:uncharacterized protein (TIGR03118 family)
MRLAFLPDHRTRGTSGRPRPVAPGRGRGRRRRPAVLESLEVRVLPSALNIVSRALTYTAAPGVANNLTIATTGATGTYTFSDPGEFITLGAGAVAAGWTGSGTHAVTGPDPSVGSIAVDTRDGTDTVSVQSVDAATTLAFTNSLGDLDAVNLGSATRGVQAILGNVTITNAAGTTALTVDDSGNTPAAARNPTVAAGAITNLAPRPIFAAAARVSVLTVKGGGLFGTLNVNAGNKGPVAVTPGPTEGSGTVAIDTDPPLVYSNFAAVAVTNVADKPLTPVYPTGGVITTTANDLALEGRSVTYRVAAFTDADPNARPGNFVASIDWGDGTPSSAGTIVADGLGQFDVNGAHTYTTAGTYPVVVTITDTGTTAVPVTVAGIAVTISDTGGSATTTGIVTRANPDLVSDGSLPAANTDPNLVNPWGITAGGTGPLAVADNKKGVATSYDGAGSPQPTVIAIPAPGGGGTATPTGVVSNGTAGFVVPGGPSRLLFDTQDGTIAGWNSGPSATLVVDNSALGAVYTGLAVANNGVNPVLFAANFHDGVVEEYDSHFSFIGSFTDPNLPFGFAPYNLQAIGGKLYVTFARQDAARRDAVAGLGDGFVDVFSTAGVLLQQLVSGAPLNAPWGLALAPGTFGQFSGDLLVANHGDGTIDAFDPATGVFLGPLVDGSNAPVTVDGLRGLSFGNGGVAGPASTLYFTAGPGGGAHGLLSSLTATPNQVTVLDAAVRLTVTNVTATEGVALNGVVSSLVVASFTDDNPFSQAGDFVATIDWGDGTSSPGVVQQTDGPGTTFSVTTQPGDGHVYREDSTSTFTDFRPYTLTVTVTDQKGGATATARGSATVNDARLMPGPVPVATFVEGIMSGDQVVAQFTDENPFATADDFNAPLPPVINWGGGSTSNGVVVADPVLPHVFDVVGAHLYVEETTGSPPNTISVAISDEGGARLTALGTAVVLDAPLANVTGLAVPSNPATPLYEGRAFTGDVALFNDTNPRGVAGNFTAAIDWGDGTPATDGTIRQDATGVFHLSGTHTYLEEGVFPIAVAIHDVGGSDGQAQGSATVLDAPFTSITPINVTATEGLEVTAKVATFVDSNTNAPLSDFAAVIDWGDGTPPSPGVITQPGGLGTTFFVAGTHTYDEETAMGNPYTVKVTVLDEGGRTISTDPGTATVADADLIATGVTPPDNVFEGLDFSGDVAFFTDLDPGGSLAKEQYAATIDWGDGKTSAGTVAADPVLGFDVSGTHTYAHDGTYSVKVTVKDDGGAQATATTRFTVLDVPLVAAGLPPIVVKEGQRLIDQVVTVFADGNPLATADEFHAAIDWGDGTPETLGTVQAVGVLFNVTGSHTYLKEGKYKTIVTITDSTGKVELVDDPEVDVGDAPLTPEEATFFATEDTAFTANVATFVDGDPLDDTDDFQAEIDWGDGTNSSGTVVDNGFVPDGVTYLVRGTHTYHDPVPTNHQVTVSIVDHDGSQTVALSVAVLAGAAGPVPAPVPAAPQGAVFTASEGIRRNFGGVATFTDADPGIRPGDFNVAINWGDNSPLDTTTGVVTVQGTDSGRTFSVSGSHLYADMGTYATAVTITDPAGHVAIANGQAIVADGVLSFVPLPFAVLAATEGQLLKDALVADFTETNPSAKVADFKATIDWGDGSPNSDGVITQAGGPGTDFLVTGDHTYAEARATPYNIMVTVLDLDTDTNGVVTPDVATIGASVLDAPLGSPSGRVIQAVEGQATPTVLLATFVDANHLATASDYQVTIHWGDGSSGAGIVTMAGALDGGEPGALVQVSGSHLYLEAQDYAVSVEIADVDDPGKSVTASATIHVADAPLDARGAPISAFEGVALVDVPVATFTDANPYATADDFPGVTIDWGDGTTSAGTVVPSGTTPNGVSFVVKGSHTYNDDETAGTEVESSQVVITITDRDGSVAVATARAAQQDPVLTDPGVDIRATEGGPFSGVVSTFSDSSPLAQAGDFVATIDWGDGTTSPGSVTATSPGRFRVAGTHTYSSAGAFTIGVTVRDNEHNSVSDTSTATVADVPLSAQGTPVRATPRTTFTGSPATFTDTNPNATAGQFRAVIAWGDGTTSTGTVVAHGATTRDATFLVSGSHAYSRKGTFLVTITIVDQGGSQATATTFARVGNGVTASVKLGNPRRHPSPRMHGAHPHPHTHPGGPLAY